METIVHKQLQCYVRYKILNCSRLQALILPVPGNIYLCIYIDLVGLTICIIVILRSLKAKILATYPDAFPDDSTIEALDRRPDLEIP